MAKVVQAARTERSHTGRRGGCVASTDATFRERSQFRSEWGRTADGLAHPGHRWLRTVVRAPDHRASDGRAAAVVERKACRRPERRPVRVHHARQPLSRSDLVTVSAGWPREMRRRSVRQVEAARHAQKRPLPGNDVDRRPVRKVWQRRNPDDLPFAVHRVDAAVAMHRDTAAADVAQVGGELHDVVPAVRAVPAFRPAHRRVEGAGPDSVQDSMPSDVG